MLPCANVGTQALDLEECFDEKSGLCESHPLVGRLAVSWMPVGIGVSKVSAGTKSQQGSIRQPQRIDRE